MEYMTHLRSESDRFASLVSSNDPDGAIPSCPGWTVTDLAWHLAEVQWFWGTVVGQRLDGPDGAENEKPERPAGHDSVVSLLEQATNRLVDSLEKAADDEAVWTWAADRTVGFVRRRQAHEALIHRVDAELGAGELPVIDPDLAGDGADEILEHMIGGVPPWATFHPDGETIRITATDVGRKWGVAHGRMVGRSPNTGKSYDIPAASVGIDAGDPGTTIEGAAADLDLWLWGRGAVDKLTVVGDRGVVDRLRALAVESTQ
jgi:uncharacterized protein (TIGR03083 family)